MRLRLLIAVATSALAVSAFAETNLPIRQPSASPRLLLVKKEHVCYCRVSNTEGCEVYTSYETGDRCECTALDKNNTCRRKPCLGTFERCQ
jgi:hypothetical protein